MARSSLDKDQAVELGEIFRVFGDPNRLRIAMVCLGEPLCVTVIAKRVGLSPALVSHHLVRQFTVRRRRHPVAGEASREGTLMTVGRTSSTRSAVK